MRTLNRLAPYREGMASSNPNSPEKEILKRRAFIPMTLTSPHAMKGQSFLLRGSSKIDEITSLDLGPETAN